MTANLCPGFCLEGVPETFILREDLELMWGFHDLCVCVCVCVCGEGGREGGEVVFDTMIFNSVILPHVVSRSEV